MRGMDEISFKEAAQSRSSDERWRAFDRFQSLEGKAQSDAGFELLETSNRELRDAVLSYCTQDILTTEPWQKSLSGRIDDSRTYDCVYLCQSVLVLLQRIDGIEASWLEFGRRCLEHKDMDVRYQAFCLLELHNESSDAYVERVKAWLESEDEDFRIVSIQALSRLRPSWALMALEERARYAFGVESFHILLTQIRICPAEKRVDYVPQLMRYLENDRFSFAAVQALSEYGNSTCIGELVAIAKGFMTEPTLKVAAAAAAAKLGSEEGIKLLEKFSKSRHGNPSYASELLANLKQ